MPERTGYRVTSVMDKVTIAYGSIMKLYVKEFRKDPEDETLSINACIVKPANIGVSGRRYLREFPGLEELKLAL